MYYKNESNKLFFKPSPRAINNHGLVAITEQGFNEQLAANITPEPPSAKATLTEALASIAYDLDTSTTVDVRGLTDVSGRIIQTRPRDKANIDTALETMAENNIATVDWVMLDDLKRPVTVSDLQAAKSAGMLRGLQVWDEYDPA